MADPRTPPANLGGLPNAYPSRRTLDQPRDAADPYSAPVVPSAEFVPQMTAAPPPRPRTPGPTPDHFLGGAIPGENEHAHGERERMTAP